MGSQRPGKKNKTGSILVELIFVKVAAMKHIIHESWTKFTFTYVTHLKKIIRIFVCENLSVCSICSTCP